MKINTDAKPTYPFQSPRKTDLPFLLEHRFLHIIEQAVIDSFQILFLHWRTVDDTDLSMNSHRRCYPAYEVHVAGPEFAGRGEYFFNRDGHGDPMSRTV